MSTRPRLLLTALFALLAARGLAAQCLDPWRGWVAFKEVSRQIAEHPDPGVSVQITALASGVRRLYYVRQVLERRGRRLEPVGGVVCEFSFAPARREQPDWDAWSLDFGTFERFVDIVEQHSAYASLMVERPVATAVYWEDAS